MNGEFRIADEATVKRVRPLKAGDHIAFSLDSYSSYCLFCFAKALQDFDLEETFKTFPTREERSVCTFVTYLSAHGMIEELPFVEMNDNNSIYVQVVTP